MCIRWKKLEDTETTLYFLIWQQISTMSRNLAITEMWKQIVFRNSKISLKIVINCNQY